MFKKVISGILSLAMCSSLAVSLKTSNETTNSNNTQNKSKSDYELSGSNSLGNYLTKLSNQSPQEPAVKTETSLFSVNALEFDAETGDVHICSTQTKDCNVTVAIADEFTGEIVKTAVFPVKSGEFVVTDETIDTSSLPEYFIVKAFLSDEIGGKISNEYVFTKYTKDMQEILEADIHDFNEAQVINFDESEDTNFIVLNEDTVISESTEDENVLVTADYDSNVFSFENADENIRSMEFGQYLYIQPNETDIIAVAVDSVETDGDITTVKGSDENIDDMFDFIKIEQNEASSTMTVDTTDKSDEVTIIDHEDEDVFVTDTDSEIKFTTVRKKYATKYEISSGVKIDFKDGEIEKISGKPNQDAADDDKDKDKDKKIEFDGDIDPGLTGSLSIDFKLNFYKKHNHINIVFSFTPTIIAGVEFGVEGSVAGKSTLLPTEIADRIREAHKKKAEDMFRWQLKLWHVAVATEIPGVMVQLDPKAVFELSGSAKISITLSETYGFEYDNEKKFDDEGSHFRGLDHSSTPLIEKEFTVEGSVSLKLVFGPKLILVNEKIASIGIEAEIGFQYDLSSENLFEHHWMDNPNNSNTKMTVFKYESDEEKEHGCDVCITGTLKFVGELNVVANIFGKGGKDDDNDFKWTLAEFELPLSLWKIHISTHCKCKKGECEYYRYKAAFNAVLANTKAPASGFTIDIDGVKVETDSNGKAYVFCDNNSGNNSYNYKVYDGEKPVGGGSFKIKNAATTIDLEIVTQIEDNGNVKYSIPNKAKETKGTVYTTTTMATTTAKKTTTTLPVSPGFRKIKEGALGDNIGYMLYEDGTMLIYGYGDMDDLKTARALEGEYDIDHDGDKENISEVVKEVIFEPYVPYQADYDTGADKTPVVPESDIKITSIGNSLFSGCSNLTTIEIPKTVTKIGDSAFRGCKKIPFGDYKIHDGVTYIGSRAFEQCYKMTTCIIPESVTKMGKGIFNKCLNFKSVTLPYAGNEPDDRSVNLTEVLFDKNGVKEYGDGEGGKFNFEYNDQYIRHSYFAGGKHAYKEQSRACVVAIPPKFDTITITGGDHLPEYAFSQCDYLKHINLPKGLKTIGNYAFDDCKAITKIELPESLKIIDKEAFNNCSSLKDITLPSNLENIGEKAFIRCTSIESMLIPANVKSIGPEAFSCCTSLKDIEISEGVKEIGTFAFQECHSLKSVVIPNSVEKIGYGIVKLCSNLKEVSIPFVGNTREKKDNLINLLFNAEGINNGGAFPANYKDSEAFIHYRYNGKIAAVPNSFKKVSVTDAEILHEYSFREVSFLDKIILNDGITTFDSNAFYSCSDVIIHIPESVTTIAKNAFNKCKNITIYGKKGSLAETIANENKFLFVDTSNNTTTASTTKTTSKATQTTKATTTTTAKPADILYGDANCNGKVDISDAVLIMQSLSNPSKYGPAGSDPTHITKAGQLNADVNETGNGVTNKDALSIQRYALQLIDKLPE